jgi:hypothetical protein
MIPKKLYGFYLINPKSNGFAIINNSQFLYPCHHIFHMGINKTHLEKNSKGQRRQSEEEAMPEAGGRGSERDL